MTQVSGLYEGVRVARVLYSDLFGRARSKELAVSPDAPLPESVSYCKTSLAEWLDGSPLEGGGFPADLGYPDLQALPDLSTARVVPWKPDTVWVIADLYEHERQSALCSRGLLRDVVTRYEGIGLVPVVAFEPEFYLLRRGPDGVVPYSPQEGVAYMTGSRADPEGVAGRLLRQLLDLGLPVTAVTRELSPGQFEINLNHGPALTAAENHFVYKEAVKELAAAEGLLATFMPQPFTDRDGSGLHLHVSLWREETNVFERDGGELSTECTSFLAGVISHARALAAFAVPTVNSYKRIRGGSLAPSTASWAHDDRHAYLRVPAERGDGTRVELRTGDASANPYLLCAALLVAGLDGMQRGLPAPTESEPLPLSLDESIRALEEDEVMREGLGDELIHVYAALKRTECERYAKTVTDWEWKTYAENA